MLTTKRRKEIFDKLAEVAVSELPLLVGEKLHILEQVLRIKEGEIPEQGALADYVAEVVDWLAERYYIQVGTCLQSPPPCPDWIKTEDEKD